jgi:hypothetical protein
MYVHVFLIHTVDTVYLLEGTVYAFNTLMYHMCTTTAYHTICDNLFVESKQQRTLHSCFPAANDSAIS